MPFGQTPIRRKLTTMILLTRESYRPREPRIVLGRIHIDRAVQQIIELTRALVDGGKVAATVQALSPMVPTAMLTGWGHRLVADDEVPPHVNRVLNKPPRLAELREILAELTA